MPLFGPVRRQQTANFARSVWSVPHAALDQQAGNVGLHGTEGHVHLCSDSALVRPGADRAQHLLFAGAQLSGSSGGFGGAAAQAKVRSSRAVTLGAIRASRGLRVHVWTSSSGPASLKSAGLGPQGCVPDSVVAVARLTDHLDRRLGVKDHHQPDPGEVVGVGNEHRDDGAPYSASDCCLVPLDRHHSDAPIPAHRTH
jgi:hypothetical protein